MWGVKLVEDMFLTYGKFTDPSKCLAWGKMEFGDLVKWQIVKVND